VGRSKRHLTLETIPMVACPLCTAKFSSAAEIEARWLDAHQSRFHDHTRATSASFAASLTEKHAA
jgi:hypothetical protein